MIISSFMVSNVSFGNLFYIFDVTGPARENPRLFNENMQKLTLAMRNKKRWVNVGFWQEQKHQLPFPPSSQWQNWLIFKTVSFFRHRFFAGWCRRDLWWRWLPQYQIGISGSLGSFLSGQLIWKNPGWWWDIFYLILDFGIVTRARDDDSRY